MNLVGRLGGMRPPRVLLMRLGRPHRVSSRGSSTTRVACVRDTHHACMCASEGGEVREFLSLNHTST